MLRFSTLCLLLAGACLTACSPATPDPAANPPVTAAVVPPPPRAAATPCPVASADNAGAVTSKARHVPNEDDPCADSRGVARH